MNDDTPLQHVDSFIYQVKWNRLLQVFWNAISLSVFSYLNLHPFFKACLRVKWKQEESDGQAIHAFHAKERWAENFHLGILNGANLITLFDFQFLYGIYHLNYLKSVIFRWKSGIHEPGYHVIAWLLEMASLGLPQVCKIF